MIHFEPPPRRSIWQWPGRILRKLRGEDWRAEFDAWERAYRLDIGRKLAHTISEPTMRADLLEKLDQAEAQERDRQANQARNKKAR